MKTTVLKSVVLLTLLFAGVLNAELSAEGKFYTNDQIKGDLTVSKTIYVKDTYLRNYMKYEYEYDAYSRMVSKESFKWNHTTNSWVPSWKLNYSYSQNKITLVLARWNQKDKAYNSAKQKNVYQVDPLNKPVAYLSYKWDDKNNDWQEVDHVNYINAFDLYAIGD